MDWRISQPVRHVQLLDRTVEKRPMSALLRDRLILRCPVLRNIGEKLPHSPALILNISEFPRGKAENGSTLDEWQSTGDRFA